MDETVKVSHTPADSQQGTLPLLERIAANLPGMIVQFLQRQDGSQSILYASSGCRELCELEPEEVQKDFQFLSKQIHPQDIKAFNEAVATSSATLAPWDWEGRIITPSGKIKWIQGISRPSRQGDNIVWDGLLMDITERKQAEELLHLKAKRDRLLAQTLSRIRSSLDLNQILQTTVKEVRQFLQTDRVCIALRDTDIHSKILAESVDPRYPSILGWRSDNDTHPSEFKKLLMTNRVRIVEDITQIAVSPHLTAMYQKSQTRASLAVPIILGEELFGALVANECSGPRHWTSIEIDLLQQMSEQVAIAIQQAQLYQELARLNTNLERQVEERTAQLQQKMQEIQELSRVKDVVLHTVSHNLKTSVLGNLMVLNNLRCSEEVNITISRSIVDRMIQGNDYQLAMIESLLEIHTGEEEVVPHREEVNFSTLLKAVIKDLEPTLNRHQATVNNLVREDLPLVVAAPMQLQKVFVNLFTYSWQHNPPGLKFTLKAIVEAGMIRCTIQNNGTRMKKLDCDRLFDLYVCAPQAPCSTGIGLKMFLSRRIIKAHGGEIGVASKPKGGFTFWFTLPLAAAPN
ncbi:MAG: GAF domain-containing protein [Rhizonema sp. PD38]|nr:GAF domain-containing protein [Rhizonema sp. PD38]